MDLREGVMAELLECYGEGDNTDWPYLNDLADLIVSMIQKYGGRCQGCEDAPVGMTVEHDATCGLMSDPRAITAADLRTMVMQEDDDDHEIRCPRHGYTINDDICDCPFCQDCGRVLRTEAEIDSGLCVYEPTPEEEAS